MAAAISGTFRKRSRFTAHKLSSADWTLAPAIAFRIAPEAFSLRRTTQSATPFSRTSSTTVTGSTPVLGVEAFISWGFGEIISVTPAQVQTIYGTFRSSHRSSIRRIVLVESEA